MLDVGTYTAAIGTTIPSGVERVGTTGYSNPGDGGDAVFIIRTSEPAHNGKIQFAGGKWGEMVDDVARPEQWGGFAVGSGDQSSAIQSAIDYVAARPGGGTVDLGHQGWRGQGLALKNNVTLAGGGMDTASLTKTSTVSDMITTQNLGTNICVRDLTLDGTSTSDAKTLLALTNMNSDVTIERVHFTNGMARWALRCDMLATYTFKNLTIRNCRFSNCPSGGVMLLPSTKGNRNIEVVANWFDEVGSNIIGLHDVPGGDRWDCNFDVRIDYNLITNCLATGTDGPIPVEAWGCTNISQNFNLLDSGTRGLTAGAHMTNGVLTGNIVSNQSNYFAEAGNARNVRVYDNTAVNCATLVAFTTSDEVTDVQITDNTLIGTGLTAYDSVNPSDIIKTDGGNYFRLLIARNRIINPEFARSAVRVRVAAGSSVLVQDNEIIQQTYNSSATGITTTVVSNGLAEIVVHGNRVTRNANFDSAHYQASIATFIGIAWSSTDAGCTYSYTENALAMKGTVGSSAYLLGIGVSTAATAMYGVEVSRNQLSGPMSLGGIFIPDSGGKVVALANDTRRVAATTPFSIGSASPVRFTARVVNGSAAPTTGSWLIGDICLNSAATATTPMFWQCVASGTPGTWVARMAAGADPLVPASYASLSGFALGQRLVMTGSSSSNVLKIRCDITSASTGMPPTNFRVRWSGRFNNAPRGGQVDLQFGSFNLNSVAPLASSTAVDANVATIASALDGSNRMEASITFPTNAGAAVIVEALHANAGANPFQSYSIAFP